MMCGGSPLIASRSSSRRTVGSISGSSMSIGTGPYRIEPHPPPAFHAKCQRTTICSSHGVADASPCFAMAFRRESPSMEWSRLRSIRMISCFRHFGYFAAASGLMEIQSSEGNRYWTSVSCNRLFEDLNPVLTRPSCSVTSLWD